MGKKSKRIRTPQTVEEYDKAKKLVMMRKADCIMRGVAYVNNKNKKKLAWAKKTTEQRKGDSGIGDWNGGIGDNP